MRGALAMIHRGGGVANARVFTKIWLALFGKYPWDGIPSLPPEIVYFPLWMPFNLYDFACWARGTVAPLTIVVSKKPVRELGVDVVGNRVVRNAGANSIAFAASGWLMVVEKLQKLYERLALPTVSKSRAPARCRLDRRAPGSRRQLGRHSAAVGVLADRAQPDGLRARPSGHAQRSRGRGAFRYRRRAGMAIPGVHVAGLGYGVGGAGVGAGRFAAATSGDATGR